VVSGLGNAFIRGSGLEIDSVLRLKRLISINALDRATSVREGGDSIYEESMSGRSDLTVEVAKPTDRIAVSNLLQLYLHDFSEILSDITVDESGLFPCADFDEYWGDDPSLRVHVFRQDGALAGFAFVNDWSPSGQGCRLGRCEPSVRLPAGPVGSGGSTVECPCAEFLADCAAR